MRISGGYFPGILFTALLLIGGFTDSYAQDITSNERPGIAGMLERVTPAVVNISVTGPASQAQNPLLEDPLFRRFFDVPQQQPRRTSSVGSGVIIDADQGYVLTNHHVIADAEQVEVTLQDRRQVPAEVVGSDANTDIALLRIDAANLHDIPLSDSDTLQVGDFVAAIGNPFGLGQTVTTGIVSALGRSTRIIADGNGYEDFIQTDASINPGNSGGALVDFNGNLVGINTAIIAPSGGNVGIGFAVPVNMANLVIDQLVEYGEVSRGVLGVRIQDLTPDLAQVLELSVYAGAVVSSVMPDSAAQRAGIQAGDVIIKVNDKAIESSRDLRNTIGLMRAGEEIELALVRNGEETTFDLEIGDATQLASTPSRVSTSNVLQGAELAAMPADAPDYADVEGVYVSQVEQGSRAWQNGVRAGDIILEVNRREVATPGDLMDIVNDSPSTAAVRIMRDDQVLFLVMR